MHETQLQCKKNVRLRNPVTHFVETLQRNFGNYGPLWESLALPWGLPCGYFQHPLKEQSGLHPSETLLLNLQLQTGMRFYVSHGWLPSIFTYGQLTPAREQTLPKAGAKVTSAHPTAADRGSHTFLHPETGRGITLGVSVLAENRRHRFP